ncbi:MAG TPA: polysaccharide biosynthesis/export family protein [Pseudacidobacterium sp.]|jgi:polysaccharide export outer membrane protein|nr:polysaccharide biosynthesis/export family protein [Pseudacidobacterium sp.]
MAQRSWRSSVWFLLLFSATVALRGQAANSNESLLISHGDMLHITVFREPDLEQHVRVKDSGEIDLDLIGPVRVAGFAPAEAAQKIAQAYVQGRYLNHPQVSVLVEEYATQQVSVLGQVTKPGAVQLMAPRSLLDVLSLAGGLTDIADRHITIQRGDKSESMTVFLPNNAQADLQSTVTVYPGDTVIVPKAGIVYVLGDVARPGGYIMQDDAKLTVLQAIAMAAGANRSAKEDATRLLRKVNGKYQERTVLLHEIERGKLPDMELEADDVLYVPFSMAKNVMLGASGIVSSTSSAAIYATR